MLRRRRSASDRWHDLYLMEGKVYGYRGRAIISSRAPMRVALPYLCGLLFRDPNKALPLIAGLVIRRIAPTLSRVFLVLSFAFSIVTAAVTVYLVAELSWYALLNLAGTEVSGADALKTGTMWISRSFLLCLVTLAASFLTSLVPPDRHPY